MTIAAILLGAFLALAPAAADEVDGADKAPGAALGAAEAEERDQAKRLIVVVQPGGVIRMAGAIVRPADITRKARELLERHPDASLLVRAHQRAAVSDIRKVTRAAAEGGMNRVVFATLRPTP